MFSFMFSGFRFFGGFFVLFYFCWKRLNATANVRYGRNEIDIHYRPEDACRRTFRRDEQHDRFSGYKRLRTPRNIAPPPIVVQLSFNRLISSNSRVAS